MTRQMGRHFTTRAFRITAAAREAAMDRGTPRTAKVRVFFIAPQNSGLVISRS